MRTTSVYNSLAVMVVVAVVSGCASNRSIEPPFEWDITGEFATPGTSLTLTELERHRMGGEWISVSYEIRATGFSPQESLHFWTRSLDGEFGWFSGTVDADGLFRLSGLDRFSIIDYAPGEPLDVALVSATTGKRAHTKVFPVPIEAQGTGGTSASAELGLATGRHFLITFRGFQPGEDVQITSRYETETKTSSGKASQDGEITFAVMFGPGDHGKAVATASGKTGTVSLEYGVGMDAFKRPLIGSVNAPD